MVLHLGFCHCHWTRLPPAFYTAGSNVPGKVVLSDSVQIRPVCHAGSRVWKTYQRAQSHSIHWDTVSECHVTGLSFPDTSVEQPLETAQGRAEIIAGDENRTWRAESDDGIYLCAIHARAICQTTPYSQARKCPGGKNLTGQTEFDQNKGRGGRVRKRYQRAR